MAEPIAPHGFRAAAGGKPPLTTNGLTQEQPPRVGGSLFRVSSENPCAHRDGLRTPTVTPPALSAAATARASPWEPWRTG
ncbi:hypothetical protein MRA01_62130 [Methylobacterium radiotolerans]|nr:hypothetical protein MRA01_62130 [Methylobacterium radiotolerans]